MALLLKALCGCIDALICTAHGAPNSGTTLLHMVLLLQALYGCIAALCCAASDAPNSGTTWLHMVLLLQVSHANYQSWIEGNTTSESFASSGALGRYTTSSATSSLQGFWFILLLI